MIPVAPDERLLRLALERFVVHGVAGTSVAEVAQAAGVEADALDPDSGALFAAAVAWATRPLRESLLDLCIAGGEPVERLGRLLARLTAIDGVERLGLQALARELWGDPPRVAAVLERALGPALEAVVRLLGEAQFRGQITPLPPGGLLMGLAGALLLPAVLPGLDRGPVLGGVHADASERGGSPDGLGAACLELVLRGLLPREGSGGGRRGPR